MNREKTLDVFVVRKFSVVHRRGLLFLIAILGPVYKDTAQDRCIVSYVIVILGIDQVYCLSGLFVCISLATKTNNID